MSFESGSSRNKAITEHLVYMPRRTVERKVL